MESTSHSIQIEPVAYYKGPFGSKFGIPRQSGLTSIEGRIVFTEKYRVREAIRGLEGFSRIWLIWGFSANRPAKGEWQPTVRPPRLGGNASMGVFATRSPYRPNPLGLSCVELVRIEDMELVVKGADLADNTPIYDIKPYIVYADSFPDAECGFASEAPLGRMKVVIPDSLGLSEAIRKGLEEALALDPRPAYQADPDRQYAMTFAGADVLFRAEGDTITVTDYRTLD